MSRRMNAAPLFSSVARDPAGGLYLTEKGRAVLEALL